MTELILVENPRRLPDPPATGLVALVDVAFAGDEREFNKNTKPFIDSLGHRLACWIDHHWHPAWNQFEDDKRFVLIPRSQAPGCPQLVTPELIERIGRVDHLLAHADFDGIVTAAKFLKGGIPPYPEADEDARAIDSPGKGYICSDRGRQIGLAMDQLRDSDNTKYLTFLRSITEYLVSGEDPGKLEVEIRNLAQLRVEYEQGLRSVADASKRLHPDVLVLRVDKKLASPDRKFLLRTLQEQAIVGIIREPEWTTVASFNDDIDIGSIEGLDGLAGYAFGPAKPEKLLESIVKQIEKSK